MFVGDSHIYIIYIYTYGCVIKIKSALFTTSFAVTLRWGTIYLLCCLVVHWLKRACRRVDCCKETATKWYQTTGCPKIKALLGVLQLFGWSMLELPSNCMTCEPSWASVAASASFAASASAASCEGSSLSSCWQLNSSHLGVVYTTHLRWFWWWFIMALPHWHVWICAKD